MTYVVDEVFKAELPPEGKPGFWLDLGTLRLGTGVMAPVESTAQFIMWCILKSVLFVTADVPSLTEDHKLILTNEDLLLINQKDTVSAASVINSTFTPQGIAHKQSVSFDCDEHDRNQQWNYLTSTKQLKHVASGHCLEKFQDQAADDHGYVVANPCQVGNVLQQWAKDDTGMQIRYHSDPTLCLTTSTKRGVAAKVRTCDLRQQIRDWQGENQWWHNFNDAFSFNAVPGQTNIFTIKNSRDRCLGMGGNEDFHSYSGLLNDGRAYLVLLNRSTTTFTVVLRLSDIPGLAQDTNYKLKNMVNGNDLGSLTADTTSQISVTSHSATGILLTPSGFS